jgi:hypothetical protein
MLDCILRGLGPFVLSDLVRGMVCLFSGLLSRCVCGKCDTDLVLSLERLLLMETLGRLMTLAIVSDLWGISVFPVATKVCDGSSSGSKFLVK